MIGCSHHDAAVDFRERLAFSGDQISAALASFQHRFPSCEMVLLITCNRVELYTAMSESNSIDCDQLTEFLSQQRDIPLAEIVQHMIYRSERQAIEHLFTVAASLDSMVVGEAQIVSQVKQAYDQACQAGAAGSMIHRIFQAANRAAKRVQTETAIHRRRVSVPSVAIGEVIPDFFDSLAKKTVLVCGAGEMSQETIRYLKDGGAKQICVVNRSYDRAVAVANEFNVSAQPWETLHDQLVGADIVVGTTSAQDPIINAETFESLHADRNNRMLLILDLAIPRDFDSSIGELSNVYLYGIDDLQAACQRNQKERKKEWPKAKQIIDEETLRLMHAFQHRETGPVIRQLREQANELKQEELVRLTNKLQSRNLESNGLDECSTKEIEKSFDRFINKLLHPPLSSIREDAEQGHTRGLLEALRHLFKLGED